MDSSGAVRVPLVDLRAQYESIRDEIQAAIGVVLDSGQFVGGELVEKFEHEFSTFIGASDTVGVGSGTAALELALRASGIGAGDDVIVPANSFFATAEAVSNAGARPVFADVNPVTYHLDIESVARVCTGGTRAVIPVHLYGRAMDMSELERFAAEKNLIIIEDAAQAHGAARDGAMVGASGHLCCFSFYPGKNLGAYGDAGAVTGKDPKVMATIRLLRDHGSAVKYQHSMIGTNSRLDTLQAAVLSVKLRHLRSWNNTRRRHAELYAQSFAGSSVLPPQLPPGHEHSVHLFVVTTPDRDALQKHLHDCGISTGIHYPIPLHMTAAYQQLGYSCQGLFPVTEYLASRILSLPIYAELTPEQIDKVIKATLDFAGRTIQYDRVHLAV